MDCNFHTLKTVTSTTEEEICLCLCQIEHVPAASRNVIYEAFVDAVLIACAVHLQNIVDTLVKPKIYKKWTNRKEVEAIRLG